jgi:hypothetical protein
MIRAEVSDIRPAARFDREVIMGQRAVVLCMGVFIAIAAVAHPDTKVVQMTHQDSFSVMGQTQPAKDEQQVLWIGADRMRLDTGTTSVLVRLDQQKMILLDHEAKTASAIDLPIDLGTMLPPGMGEQMMQMMQFDVTVNPKGEKRQIGEWQTTGYDVSMTSQMMSITSTLWATTDLDVDFDAYYDLYTQILSLQPGMKKMADEMRQIKGLVIEQDGVASMPMMGDASFKTSQKTVSIDTIDPPPDLYEIPPDYTDEPFDYMSFMKQQQ